MHFNLLEFKYRFITNNFRFYVKYPFGGGGGSARCGLRGVRDVDCVECAMWTAWSARCGLRTRTLARYAYLHVIVAFILSGNNFFIIIARQ
jgi:hypothetical protein